MRHRLYVHIVWTTRDRLPLIDRGVATFLTRFLGDVARQERATMLGIGMVNDHLHLLLRLHPATSLPRLLQRLKGGSACIANGERHAPRASPLQWAKGYSVMSVSERLLDVVGDYIMRQAVHHPDRAIPGWQAPSRVTSVTDAEPSL